MSAGSFRSAAISSRVSTSSVRFRSVRDLDSPDGNRTGTRRQPIREEFTDQVLFLTPSRVSETVEGRCPCRLGDRRQPRPVGDGIRGSILAFRTAVGFEFCRRDEAP
jgi:hypothetical protein